MLGWTNSTRAVPSRPAAGLEVGRGRLEQGAAARRRAGARCGRAGGHARAASPTRTRSASRSSAVHRPRGAGPGVCAATGRPAPPALTGRRRTGGARSAPPRAGRRRSGRRPPCRGHAGRRRCRQMQTSRRPCTAARVSTPDALGRTAQAVDDAAPSRPAACCRRPRRPASSSPSPSAAARDCIESSASPRSTASTTSALEPRVPGTAGLGGVRVDLGGGEGDLAGVAQHRLAQGLLLAGLGEGGGVLLDDVDDRAHQVEGLAQRDRPGQLPGRRAEDVGGDRGLVAALRAATR